MVKAAYISLLLCIMLTLAARIWSHKYKYVADLYSIAYLEASDGADDAAQLSASETSGSKRWKTTQIKFDGHFCGGCVDELK